MTRKVQLELTLDVELDCDHLGGRWYITRIDEVKSGRNVVRSGELLYEFLLNEKADALIDLFLEQEA